jgi:hypothetical protein
MVLSRGCELLVVIDQPCLSLDKLVKELVKELVTQLRQFGPLRFKLRDKCLAKLAHTGRQHNAVFVEQASDFIDQGSAHVHEAFPGAVEGLDILLGEPFHRYKAHRRPCHRFPDGFSVPHIVLMGLDIRFDS